MGEFVDGILGVEEAKSLILANISKLGSESINIAEAHGRVLAEDLASRITQPQNSVSAMDGYAVKAEDLENVPVTLRMIGESAAGQSFTGNLGTGETVRIFTGATLPNGADSIVIQEDAEAIGDQVKLNETVSPGRYVRPRGLDFKEGQVLLKSGTMLNSRHVALVAGMNIPWVKVTRKPKVAILSTGNELVLPGEAVGEDQIISSNSIGMAAFLEASGGSAINLGIARDTAESLKDLLHGVETSSDMLVTIGGASVGDYDLIKSVLEQLFWNSL